MSTNSERDPSLATPTSKSAADPDSDAIPTHLAPGGFTTPEPIEQAGDDDAQRAT